MDTNITANGSIIVGGINQKREFVIALSGEFGGAKVEARYPIAENTYEPFSSDPIEFTAAGEIIGTNCGILPELQLLVTDATGSTDIRAIVQTMPRP